jgi:hypothetical protein
MNTGVLRCRAGGCVPFACMRNGLVGISSDVSYQLDHAPAVPRL